jgi:hypothetical protein
MIIREEEQKNQVELLEIKSATYIGDFAVRVEFNDHHKVLVDFKPFLMKALRPGIRKYQEELYFKQFKIVDGNLNWNDYEMIFPLDDIYKVKI